jgi:hypothetical protein
LAWVVMEWRGGGGEAGCETGEGGVGESADKVGDEVAAAEGNSGAGMAGV